MEPMTSRPEYHDVPPGWDSPEAYWAWKESRQEACFHASLAGLDVRGDAHCLDFQSHGLENDERTITMGSPTHSTEVKVETDDATTTVSTADDATTEAETPDEASTSADGETTEDASSADESDAAESDDATKEG